VYAGSLSQPISEQSHCKNWVVDATNPSATRTGLTRSADSLHEPPDEQLEERAGDEVGEIDRKVKATGENNKM